MAASVLKTTVWSVLLCSVMIGVLLWAPWIDRLDGDRLRVATFRYLSYAPIFIAQEEGFFEDEGLDIEFLMIPRSDAAIPPLSQGQVDVMPIAMMPSVMNIIQRGGPIRIVAGRGHISATGCAYSGIIARSELLDSGELDSIEDLRGRNVATDRSSPTYFLFEHLLASADLDLDDMNVFDISGAVKIEAFKAGTIDASTFSEPWLTRLKHDGATRLWVSSGDLIPGYQFGQMMYGPRLLGERRDLGKRFMKAYLRGVQMLNEQGKTTRILDIVEKHTRLPRKILADSCWPHFHDDIRIQTDSLEQFQQWAYDQGLVSGIIPVEDMIDTSFIEYANQAVGTDNKL